MTGFDGDVLIYNKFIDKMRWQYWRRDFVYWIVLVVVFSFLGFVLLLPLSNPNILAVRSNYSETLIGTIRQMLHGAVVGSAGYFILRKHIFRARRWIWFTSIGYGAGYVLENIAELALFGFTVTGPAYLFIVLLALNSVSTVTTAFVQSVELNVWFLNARPWILAALLQALITATVFWDMKTHILGLSPGFLNSLGLSAATAAIQGIAMIYMLRREFSLEEAERSQLSENSSLS